MRDIELILYWWKARAHTTTTMPTQLSLCSCISILKIYDRSKREFAVTICVFGPTQPCPCVSYSHSFLHVH